MPHIRHFAIILFTLIFFLPSSLATSPHPRNSSLNPTSHQISVPDHVYMAIDNFGTLFVNGVPQLSVSDWRNFGYASLALRDGDVVSIIAADTGVWYGAIVELFAAGGYYVTGRDDWRARKAFTESRDWMLPSYSEREACKWPRAELRPRAGEWHAGKATYFKSPTAARYVWAADAGEGDRIFMRFTVGGMPCRRKSTVHFSGDNHAWLYVNGVLRRENLLWHTFQRVLVNLGKGDVVAIRVRDTGVWWGAIASVQLGAEYWSTGRDDWRAVKAFETEGNEDAWMLPSYNACRWPKAVLRPNPGVIIPGKAPGFFYNTTGANYVWAQNAGEGDEIFLRTVVGFQC